MQRPSSSEYPDYYEPYISLVPEDNVLQALEAQLGEAMSVLKGVPESEGNVRHAPYTWSIKEVIGHLADSEQIFGARALRFARADTTPLPGFDEKPYVAAGEFDRASLRDLVNRFEALRRSHLYMFRTLSDEAWLRKGEVDGKQVSVRALAYGMVGHARHHTAILRQRLAGAALAAK